MRSNYVSRRFFGEALSVGLHPKPYIRLEECSDGLGFKGDKNKRLSWLRETGFSLEGQFKVEG